MSAETIVKGVCRVSYIPSVNRIYRYKRGGKRELTDEARNYKSEIINGVTLKLPENLEIADWPYELHIGFYFRTQFWRRDYDNPIKITQDAIAEALGINDNKIVGGYPFKRSLERIEGYWEYVYYKLVYFDKEYEELYIKEPLP